MPRIFSDADRKAIRQALMDEGRRRFQQQGLRRTNVEQLARAVGIAKGTFYNFFDSKEGLCMEILAEEEAAVAQEVRGLLARHSDALEALRAVMTYTIRFVRGHSLLTRLRENGELVVLNRGVMREAHVRHFERDTDFAGEVLKVLQKKGADCSVKPATMAGILRALVMLSFHEEDIGSEVFGAAMELIVTWVSRGLVGGLG